MKAFICLIAVLLPLVLAISAPSPVPKRVLVLLDDFNTRQSHSLFFNSLSGRGFDLTFKRADDPDLALAQYGEYVYDALVHFAPHTEEYGGDIDAQAVIDFVDSGRNVLLAADETISEAVRSIATGCGVDFAEEGALVVDHFNYDTIHDDGQHAYIVATQQTDATKAIVGKAVGSVLFHGVGHTLDDSSELLYPLLTSDDTAFSHAPEEVVNDYPHSTGKTTVLVSALQARNNARVVFSGSLDLFSNKFFSASVQKVGKTASQKADNQVFAQEVSKWLFNEKGVLHYENVNHHSVGQTAPAETYRIKDDITFSIDVYEWKDGSWQPFTANDLQLDFVRLDPHVRTVLKHDKKGHFTTTFKIPDVYGMFTFKAHYNRLGYSYLEAITRVPVRPYRHNEYERFIESAYPYYAGCFSMLGAFVVFSVVFLYSKY